MASLEFEIMKSYTLSCEVIKDMVIQHLQNAALHNEIKISKDDLPKINNIVATAVDYAARNSARQLQSAIKQATVKK